MMGRQKLTLQMLSGLGETIMEKEWCEMGLGSAPF